MRINAIKLFIVHRAVWLAFITHTLIVIVAVVIASQLPQHAPAGFVNPNITTLSPVIEKFMRWDAQWYTYVAEFGYTIQSIVFFPAIIVLIKLLAKLGIGYDVAGFVICNLFAFISFYALNAVFRLDFSEKQTERALLAYAVMPTSIFLNSIYTESLFITFAAFCVYFTRLGKWRLAGIFGALTTTTRNLGICILIFMACEIWYAYKRYGKLTKTMLYTLLVPLAFATFMLYNYWTFGDPIAFVHSQKGWGRQFELPWINVRDNFALLLSSAPQVETGLILDGIFTVAAFIGLMLVTFMPAFKIHRSYLTIVWLWFAIPLFSTSPYLPLYSMSRFVLVLFPLYTVFGRMTARYFYSYIFVSAIVLLVCAILFVNWYWVG